eukprot:209152-Amphidinium_carterae.1
MDSTIMVEAVKQVICMTFDKLLRVVVRLRLAKLPHQDWRAIESIMAQEPSDEDLKVHVTLCRGGGGEKRGSCSAMQ